MMSLRISSAMNTEGTINDSNPLPRNKIVNVLFRKDGFEELKAKILETALSLQLFPEDQVVAVVNHLFRNLFTARRTILNTCEKSDVRTCTAVADMYKRFGDLKIGDDSETDDLRKFSIILSEFYNSQPIYHILEMGKKIDHNLSRNYILYGTAFAGPERVPYLHKKGFFDNNTSTFQTWNYIEESGDGPLKSEVFFGTKIASFLVKRQIYNSISPALREICGLENFNPNANYVGDILDVDTVVSSLQKHLKSLYEPYFNSRFYDNRKFNIFLFHDFSKDRELFLEWAHTVAGAHFEKEYLLEKSNEYFEALNRHFFTCFYSTELRGCIRQGPIIDAKSVFVKDR
ncbi:hypothetical protein CJU89_6708 [Yarrowia sp. B02]|nr:hypothetical protein CJU89_6708 [Yarrowia sp. B02]